MKFKVGDRVAVYDYGTRVVDTVIGVDEDGFVLLEYGMNPAHPKQLRRTQNEEREKMKLTYTIEIETIESGFSCKTFVNGKEQAIFIRPSLKGVADEVKELLIPSFEVENYGVVQ